MVKNIFTPSGYHWVFRTFIHLRDGSVLYAHQCGKKAFRFLVPDEE